MATFIAIGHIVGALIVLVAFTIAIFMLASWGINRNSKYVLQEMSFALGISVAELNNSEYESMVLHFVATKFSSELFCNRLSDLCGWVQTCWGWVGLLLQVGFFFGAIWCTVTNDITDAVYAWWIIVVAFFFWVSSAFFALACKLLTGRFPGQARQARKMLAQVAEQPSVVTDRAHFYID